MARRVVLLGWGDEAYVIESMLDADLLVKHKMCRVSFVSFDGDLADAVTLRPHKECLGVTMENATEDDFRRAIKRIGVVCTSMRRVEIASA